MKMRLCKILMNRNFDSDIYLIFRFGVSNFIKEINTVLMVYNDLNNIIKQSLSANLQDFVKYLCI